jgi:hypothetical protein
MFCLYDSNLKLRGIPASETSYRSRIKYVFIHTVDNVRTTILTCFSFFPPWALKQICRHCLKTDYKAALLIHHNPSVTVVVECAILTQNLHLRNRR